MQPEISHMQLDVHFDSAVSGKFPELAVCIGTINNVHVERDNEEIRKLKNAIYEQVKNKYNIETLKDNTTVRAYRDFYWKLDIDPTKTRPAGEALLRRVLNGNELSAISTVVDAYNLASMKTIVPISGFDRDYLHPLLQVRFAKKGENFTGISMAKPLILTESILVMADEKQALSIYPYRDCDYTKITMETQNVLVVGYGALGITREQMEKTVETTLSYITQVAGGEIETTKVFSSTPE
jgi:DNA/RNA-binding domain of Phe-tRNA-synthetase-like protein